MPYNIVFSPAEDIVGVVDAVLAKPNDCKIDFIAEFADISIVQTQNALHMAQELGLVTTDEEGNFICNSYLARLIVSSRNDNHKAAIMRLVLEQYEPYITFKSRYSYGKSLDLASKQIKTLYGMASNYKDIKNTIIDIATYTKAMTNDGASNYLLNQDDVSYIEILDVALKFKANDDNALQQQLGSELYDYLDKNKVFNPLSDAYSKIQNYSQDPKAPISYAGNAFESFLQQIADKHGVDLSGRHGILQKSEALHDYISKKHRGMIQYIAQIRNANDHGADADEDGNVWNISDETAQLFPIIVTSIIKDIYKKENGELVV